jgi:hypothetical protein
MVHIPSFLFFQQSLKIVSLCNHLTKSAQLRKSKSTDFLNDSRNTLEEEDQVSLCLLLLLL